MDIRELLKSNILVMDGAMGTSLISMRPDLAGMLSEKYNIEAPEAVCQIHRAYFEAGTNIIATNTFGANSLKYDSKTLEKIFEKAFESAKFARDTANAPQQKFIALDIGPTGKLLKPFGDLDFEEAVNVFKESCRLGVKYGADLILIETFTDLYETKAAVIAAKETCDLPIFVTNAYSENGRLMTGATPKAVIATLEGLGASAIGINCSFGPKESLTIIEEYIKNASVPVIFKPNAGIPDQNGNYDITAAEFAEIVLKAAEEGISCIGGCCGTNFSHIEALAKGLKNITVKTEIKAKKPACVTSALKTVEFGEKSIIIGERLNPTGKKKLKEALKNSDIDYVVKEGENQEKEGADVLDVNVGLPGIDEPEMMAKAVLALSQSVDCPLEIDTTNPAALEKALRIYNGKPLINSVNGTKESMEAVFPLAKKYGGVVVCLLLDEGGIPEKAEDRIKIAEKIIKNAESYGIDKNELIFDALCLSVATDKNSAKTTLECVKKLTEMGLKTVLGVSNISYGLPARDIVNGTFYTMALKNGLSAAIINPYSAEMQKAYKAYNALAGLDENFEDFIEFSNTVELLGKATDKPAEAGVASNGKIEESEREPLINAIFTGKPEIAKSLTQKLLDEGNNALSIINEKIIPALNLVGKDYETGKIFLPRLLTSADAAGAAFDAIKAQNDKAGEKKTEKAKFVIATVKGDIHDIGKNIVKMLLANYGYDVIDLGRDVPIDNVLTALENSGAKLLGLSALMTTTLPAMKETIEKVHAMFPDVKICVGGAVLTQEYADEIGADKYAKDAMQTVAWAEEIVKNL